MSPRPLPSHHERASESGKLLPRVAKSKFYGPDLCAKVHQICCKIPKAIAIKSGKSHSPEQLEHGVIFKFNDWAALHAYQDHPDHQRPSGALAVSFQQVVLAKTETADGWF